MAHLIVFYTIIPISSLFSFRQDLKSAIACLFGKRIFWGLFFGSLITALVFLTDDALKIYFDNSAVVYALISAGSPIFTMWLINNCMPLGEQLENLNIQKIL